MTTKVNDAKLQKVKALLGELDKVVIGYDDIKKKLLVALLSDGHIVLESMPGLAKTMMVNTLQTAIEGAKGARIQMTPDLKPTDVLGVEVYNQKSGEFDIRTGPMIGANLLLADEINRTTPKTLSAMLQAMQERYVDIGGSRYTLEDPFLVLATMNPVEQEGTFPLPEALLDRFMFKLIMSYVSRQDEVKMLANTGVHGRKAMDMVEKVITTDDIKAVQQDVQEIADGASEHVREYIVDLMRATRPSDKEFKRVFDDNGVDFSERIAFGASPRSAIWMQRGAAVVAWFGGRDYIIPDDVKAIARDTLRHRIIPTQEAVFAPDFSVDKFLSHVLKTVPIVGQSANAKK